MQIKVNYLSTIKFLAQESIDLVLFIKKLKK